ncbi:Rrp15p-domain-containing protein [Diaporthe sp. PMI_573]|nr:Rrp15p-domain-containing protein [Diaporthaceae sp. PMI_573]
MAGTTYKKRSRDDASKSKAAPPLKKQKKQKKQQTPSRGDESDDAQEFQAVNLLDSDDDDIHNAQADDGGDSGSDADSVGSMSSSEDERPRATRTKPARPQPIARDVPANKLAKDAPASRSKSGWDEKQDQSGDDDEGENDEYSDLDGELSSDGHSGDGGDARGGDDHALLKRTSKNKRNDPEAFSTSMTKILGTKISGKNRADPVLARSAEARERVRQVLDEDLDRKARRKMREQRQRAMEKGRVRDVLVATNATFSNVNPVTGKVVSVADADGETTAEVLATERRLRKVAQRGVVQLFNAFRTAQVKAAEAERVARKQGVIGMDNKKDKVTEMSKKGFLDLIASGGGGLKKGPIEEA